MAVGVRVTLSSHTLSLIRCSLPAIIYLNLRVTKEGLTREELLRELGLPEQLELEEPTEIAVAIAETKPALDQENKIVYTLV